MRLPYIITSEMMGYIMHIQWSGGTLCCECPHYEGTHTHTHTHATHAHAHTHTHVNDINKTSWGGGGGSFTLNIDAHILSICRDNIPRM